MANSKCPLRETIAKVKVRGTPSTLLVMERSGEHSGVSQAESARFYERHRDWRQVGGREEARGHPCFQHGN